MENNFDVTLKEMIGREKYVCTGCPVLDKIFKGGIPCQGITQFYGAAGTGKTQLALQISLNIQLPVEVGGLGAGAIYICTEGTFPIRRLHELIETSDIATKYGINGDKIFVQHVATTSELESCVLERIPVLMAVYKIGLLIIDSIAAPYRVEDWSEESYSRGKSLRLVGQQLHKLSRNGDLCIVCINQVSTVESKKAGEISEEQPCLGITWSSMITNSIYFYRTGLLRYLTITRSPFLKEITSSFEICAKGIRGKAELPVA